MADKDWNEGYYDASVRQPNSFSVEEMAMWYVSNEISYDANKLIFQISRNRNFIISQRDMENGISRILMLPREDEFSGKSHDYWLGYSSAVVDNAKITDEEFNKVKSNVYETYKKAIIERAEQLIVELSVDNVETEEDSINVDYLPIQFLELFINGLGMKQYNKLV